MKECLCLFRVAIPMQYLSHLSVNQEWVLLWLYSSLFYFFKCPIYYLGKVSGFVSKHLEKCCWSRVQKLDCHVLVNQHQLFQNSSALSIKWDLHFEVPPPHASRHIFENRNKIMSQYAVDHPVEQFWNKWVSLLNAVLFPSPQDWIQILFYAPLSQN